MPDLLGYLRRQTLARGVVGGSRVWLILGGAAWLVRIIGSVSSTKKLQTVLSEELSPGQSLIITRLSDDIE